MTCRDCESNSNDLLALVTGSIIGAAVGAVTALLLAPSTGEQTRSIIRREGKRAVRLIKNNLGEWQEESLDPMVKNVRSKVDGAMDKVDTTVNKAKTRVEGIKDDVVDAARTVRRGSTAN